MPMWTLIWLVLLTGLLLSHIYMDIREMNSLRNEIADNLRAMNANGEYFISGDGTAGRVLRSINVRIENGGENAIKCTVFSRFNGDAFPAVDGLGKGETDGNINLDATGSIISLKGDGLTGNLVAIIAGELVWNNSGTSIELITPDEGGAGDADIMIRFFSDASETAFDLATEISYPKSINYDVLYITDA